MLLDKNKVFISWDLNIYLRRSGVSGVTINYRLEGPEFESRQRKTTFLFLKT